MSYSSRAAVAVVTAFGMVSMVTACSGGQDHSVNRQSAVQRTEQPVNLGNIAPAALTTAHDCTGLLKYYQQAAARLVGPFGLNGGLVGAVPGVGSVAAVGSGVAAEAGGGLAPTARMAAGSSNDSATFGSAPNSNGSLPNSSTNVQVAGVDESDVVKTSGNLMVSVVAGAVRVTRLDGRRTRTIATWRQAAGAAAQSVLLDRRPDGTDTAIILSAYGFGRAQPALVPAPNYRNMLNLDSGTSLTLLDLSDPTHPRPIRRLDLTGVPSGSARLVDGELRLAITADVRKLAWKQPRYSAKPMSTAQRLKVVKRSTVANQKLVAHSTLANWLPQATVTELAANGKQAAQPVHRPLLDCTKVSVPQIFSGLQTLAMVSIDLSTSRPLADWRAAGVVASGGTLYATADHAWLATSDWAQQIAATAQVTDGVAAPTFQPTSMRSQIHLFDTPARTDPRYVASGEVAGSLLDEFSMDERNGLLRVASTTAPSWSPARQPLVNKDSGRPVVQSQGRVSVLQVDGDRLNQVGLITGLGKGEQIRGVRFDGDIGYVVTYHQLDPLYTVDLSDPLHPRLRGELKVPGYSAYLHPVSPDRVLGLGQDGTANGQITGLQLSLFDVSNLDSPRRLSRQRLTAAWSDAEDDHHAFTMTGDLVLIPFTSSGSPPRSTAQRYDAGVIAVRVSADKLGTPTVLRPRAAGPIETTATATKAEFGRLDEVFNTTPLRTVVFNGTIYTLTPTGIAAHDGTDFHRLTFAPF